MANDNPALESRVVEPVQGWDRFARQRCWGEHAELIEDWFGAGEELQHSAEELQIDEPDRWERAIDWVRTLFVPAGA